MDKKKSYEKLDILAKNKGVSYYAIANELGLASSLFSEWKSGKSTPKIDKLLKIANYFEVPIEYFLEG